MAFKEYNFDGLVGPTHNYAGLSYGNVASTSHRHQASNPRAAALQGLEKMRMVRDLGIPQAVLPPLPRPRLAFLRQLGFQGSRQNVLSQVAQHDPVLLAVAFSASSMWTANAATVSPSVDCEDGKLHLTIANLASGLHRSIEASGTFQILKAIFANEERFVVHPPLPGAMALTDEGAANHTRLCSDFGKSGIETFVYGRVALDSESREPRRFPARQTREASQAIIRNHGLDPQKTVVVQQSPEAIDAGVFHNDVISVGNGNVLLCHEGAFVEQASRIEEMRKKFSLVCDGELSVCELSSAEISLQDCVSSYLFNSQLLTRPDGKMLLLCPKDCEENEAAFRSTQKIVNEVAEIDEVCFVDLRQSMNNGGGPACLRLRVVLSDEQAQAIHQGVVLTDERYEKLRTWVETHYRDELNPDDLLDPALPVEVDAAMVALGDILELPLFELSSR